jgi:hypothetical protein
MTMKIQILRVQEHRMETGDDALPVRRAQYKVSFALRNEMENQVQDIATCSGFARDL